MSYPQIKLNAIVPFCRVLQGLSNDLYFKLDPNRFSGEVLKILGKTTENRRFPSIYGGNDIAIHFFL